MPISNKSWSQFSESDYDLAQWHRACILHLHDGEPTSKAQCKLPVREPDGTLNRNGVFAAAGALAGARTALEAPMGKKEAAARALVRLYGEIKAPVPDSVQKLANSSINAAIRSAARR